MAAATASVTTDPAGHLKILVVDGERPLCDVLETHLRQEGYEPLIASDGGAGLRLARTHLPDLILLERILPDRSGLEVCRELKASPITGAIPIILLSARAEETDQILGFAHGCDDYVAKPFSVKVLLQRIKARQRGRDALAEPPAPEQIECLDVRIDRVRHRAFVGDRELDLTPTEFRLLECLLRQPGRAFTRHQLMETAIGEGAIVLERTIDVHIKTLRRKLNDHDLIETVRGVGYRFRETRDSGVGET